MKQTLIIFAKLPNMVKAYIMLNDIKKTSGFITEPEVYCLRPEPQVFCLITQLLVSQPLQQEPQQPSLSYDE